MGYMSIELKETIREFLRDRHVHELAYRKGCYNCLLMRSRYDEETDFFYLLQSYKDNDPHQVNDQPDYAGIYSHVHGTLAAPCYSLRACCDEKWNADEIFRRFSEDVQTRILKLIDGKPVPLTKDAEPSRFNRDSFLAYGASSQALELFYEGKDAVYAPSYRLENPPTEQFMNRQVSHIIVAYLLERAHNITGAINGHGVEMPICALDHQFADREGNQICFVDSQFGDVQLTTHALRDNGRIRGEIFDVRPINVRCAKAEMERNPIETPQE